MLPAESVFTARIELRVPLLPERDAAAPAVTPPSAFENLPRFAEASASLIVPKVRTETAIAEMRMPYLLAEFMIYPLGDKTLGENDARILRVEQYRKKMLRRRHVFMLKHCELLRISATKHLVVVCRSKSHLASRTDRRGLSFLATLRT
jgi:hypothetical protein